MYIELKILISPISNVCSEMCTVSSTTKIFFRVESLEPFFLKNIMQPQFGLQLQSSN